jgi:hypothetical protein
LNSNIKYRSIVGICVKRIMQQWTFSFLKNRKTSTHTSEISFDILDFELSARINFNGKKYKSDGFSESGDDILNGKIFIDFKINKEDLPKMWSEIYFDLIDVMRHEIEHLLQSGYNKKKDKYFKDDSKERVKINKGLLPSYRYLLLPKEIDANLYGLKLKAQKKKQSFLEIINKHLDSCEISEEEREKVLREWRKRAIKLGGLPKF